MKTLIVIILKQSIGLKYNNFVNTNIKQLNRYIMALDKKNPSFWWEKSEQLYYEWIETKSRKVWKNYIISLENYYKLSWGEIM